MDQRGELQQQLERDRDDIIKLVQDMVRIPSENPPGDTTDLSAFVADYLEQRGLDYQTIDPVPEWPNLLASFEGGNPGRHLVLNGHLDVFPAGDPSRWSVDPYAAEIRDGKLYGRGAADMKTGTAASILTYAYLSRIREYLNGRLTLAVVSDEESGSVWGAQYLLENHPLALGDCMLNGEPSGPETIRFGEKGALWLKVALTAPGGYGPYAHVSRNAIKEGAKLISQLESLTEVPFDTPPDVEQQIEAARHVLDELHGAGTTDIVKSVTLNIGVINGGAKMNLIAADCHMEIDIRCPIGLTRQQLLNEFETILNQYEGASYSIVIEKDPNVCAPDHEMVDIVSRNAEMVRGIRPVPAVSVGGTDCRLWRVRGVPAYMYGPASRNVGAPDEYVTLDDLLGTVNVHVLSAYDYLNAVSP